jgi:hypothetical protein
MMDGVERPHIDLELLVVPDCPNALAAEKLLRAALDAAGLADPGIRVTVIKSQREAEERGFVGSPTVLINGVDPFAEPDRPPALACRIYPGSAGLPSIDELTRELTS